MRLMQSSVFDLLSPTISHQPSSFVFGKRGACTDGTFVTSSASRSKLTITVTESPEATSSASSTSNVTSTFG